MEIQTLKQKIEPPKNKTAQINRKFNYLISPLKVLPALNTGALEAGISI